MDSGSCEHPGQGGDDRIFCERCSQGSFATIGAGERISSVLKKFFVFKLVQNSKINIMLCSKNFLRRVLSLSA